MSNLVSRTITLTCVVLLTSALIASADAVDERLKASMEDCAFQKATEIGSPLSDNKKWSEIVGASTLASFAMIKIIGTEGHSDIVAAMNARTSDMLISTLEERGFKGFRQEVLETVEYCMPFALVAASDEMEKQKNASCPDDTDYKDHVAIITASEAERKARFGTYANDILKSTKYMLPVTLIIAFPEVFRYGDADHPVFRDADGLASADKALNAIDTDKVSEVRPLVDQALASIKASQIPQSDRVGALVRQLTCVKDWLDIYPETLPEVEPLSTNAPDLTPLDTTAADQAAIDSALSDATAPVTATTKSEANKNGLDESMVQPLGAALNSDEVDHIRQVIGPFWNIGSLTTEATRVTVTMRLEISEDQKVLSVEMVDFTGGTAEAAQQAFEAAKRAVYRAASHGLGLDTENYENWKSLLITFDTSQGRIR